MKDIKECTNYCSPLECTDKPAKDAVAADEVTK